MRRALSESSLEVTQGSRISLTASFGIAQLAPGQASEQLLSRADAALYEAKSAGKNRVSLAPAALGG
jgi:diguanylate cyclase (GGDEF)-like protein